MIRNEVATAHDAAIPAARSAEFVDVVPPVPSVARCIAAVSRRFGVERELFASASRTRHLARARHVAMYVARERIGASYPEIGAAFNRDHSTVIYAVQRVRDLLLTDASLAAHVRWIFKTLDTEPTP